MMLKKGYPIPRVDVMMVGGTMGKNVELVSPHVIDVRPILSVSIVPMK